MLVGHFAVGLGAKRIAPKVSLGTLMLAAVAADLLFWFFVLLGVEHVRVQPGITATNALDLYDIPLSHSLLMDTVWAVLLGGFYFLRHRNPRGASGLAMVVLSHWVLDFVSHRRHAACARNAHLCWIRTLQQPSGNPHCGRTALAYRRSHLCSSYETQEPRWTFGFWLVVALLTLLWISTLNVSAPSNLHAAGISSLIFFSCVVAWAYWMNSVRPLKWKRDTDLLVFRGRA